MTTQEMVNMIQGMDQYDLLSLARLGRGSVMFPSMREAMGSEVNPRWIVGQAIESAYDRELIDEQEQDWLRRQAGL